MLVYTHLQYFYYFTYKKTLFLLVYNSFKDIRSALEICMGYQKTQKFLNGAQKTF
jgi:hypothetical protein